MPLITSTVDALVRRTISLLPIWQCDWHASAGPSVPGAGFGGADRLLLNNEQAPNALLREVEQAIHGGTVEWFTFSRALDLDVLAAISHDHVEINLGTRIFGVAQIEQRLATNDSHTDGGDGAPQRRGA